jgi:hypothetical protein
MLSRFYHKLRGKNMKSDVDKFAFHMHKTYGVSLSYIAMFCDPGAEEPEVLLSVLSLVQASVTAGDLAIGKFAVARITCM